MFKFVKWLDLYKVKLVNFQMMLLSSVYMKFHQSTLAGPAFLGDGVKCFSLPFALFPYISSTYNPYISSSLFFGFSLFIHQSIHALALLYYIKLLTIMLIHNFSLFILVTPLTPILSL